MRVVVEPWTSSDRGRKKRSRGTTKRILLGLPRPEEN